MTASQIEIKYTSGDYSTSWGVILLQLERHLPATGPVVPRGISTQCTSFVSRNMGRAGILQTA